MSYKIFPECVNGDQFTMRFDYREERDAFTTVVEKLRAMFSRNKWMDGAVDTTIESKELFRTTLQREVAEANFEHIKKILGLHVLSIYEDATRIIRYG